MLKFLLTSGGIRNDSIYKALEDLQGKPLAECNALVIPTATYAMGGPAAAWRIITGAATSPLCGLGWKSMGVLELTALPSIDEAQWVPWVQEADALLVAGGDALYLGYWMRQSGLAALLPSLSAVYVGVSGGSMVMAPGSARSSSLGSRRRGAMTGSPGGVCAVSTPGPPHFYRELAGRGRKMGCGRGGAGVRD